MFMIMPKPAAQPQPQGPRVAGRPARVKAACDRCRHKKIKCDGLRPCARCRHEQLVCTAAKKPPPTDPLSASREYIQSLESRQSSLVRALRRMHRLLRQPLTSNDMVDVADALKSCGLNLDDAAHPDDAGRRKRKRSDSDISSRASEEVKRAKHDHQLLAQPSPAIDPALLPNESSTSLPDLQSDPFLGLGFIPFSPNSLLNYLDSSAPNPENPSDFLLLTIFDS